MIAPGYSRILLALTLTLLPGLTGCELSRPGRSQTPSAQPPGDEAAPQSAGEARLLSAFFGLDNDLPLLAAGLHLNAPGQDGLPAVFSHALDPDSLEPAHFEIVTRSGAIHTPLAATLRPADEADEGHTALLLGEFGNANDDPPVTLRIAGSLRTTDGQSLNGLAIAITPLAEGPTPVIAEWFRLNQKGDAPNNTQNNPRRNGRDCPRESTALVVRLVWSGGVRARNGAEPTVADARRFAVLLAANDGSERTVYPDGFGDLNDRDNVLDLCLGSTAAASGTPRSVRVAESTLIDPRGDANPETSVQVQARP